MWSTANHPNRTMYVVRDAAEAVRGHASHAHMLPWRSHGIRATAERRAPPLFPAQDIGGAVGAAVEAVDRIPAVEEYRA